MLSTVLTYGTLSGLLSIALSLLAPHHCKELSALDAHSVALRIAQGYLLFALVQSPVFFGMRSYRDHVNHGRLSFVRAMAIALSMSVLSTVLVVLLAELFDF